MPQSHLLEHKWALSFLLLSNLSIPHFMASFPSAPCCQDNWPTDFCARNRDLAGDLKSTRLTEHLSLVSRFSGSGLAPVRSPTRGRGEGIASSVPYKPQLPSSAMALYPPMQPALSPPSGPPHQRLSGSAGCSGHRNGGGSSGLFAGVPVRCSAPGDVPL